MLKVGEVRVWRVRLDGPPPQSLPGPSADEESRAALFHASAARERYLRAHRALRAVLARATAAPLHFAATEKGKPYLPAAPDLKFSLSHSHAMALIAAALHVDVGVDVERLRPLSECQAIAERFFPPSEAAAFAATPDGAREREFFRRWTRIEAMLKARGVGLYGAGAELGGDWTLREIDGCEGYAAAVAATAPGMTVVVEDL
jgi:4'-phosphopantetheinyl transferase